MFIIRSKKEETYQSSISMSRYLRNKNQADDEPVACPNPITIIQNTSRPTFSQHISLKIRRLMLLNNMRIVEWRILRLLNCERVGRFFFYSEVSARKKLPRHYHQPHYMYGKDLALLSFYDKVREAEQSGAYFLRLLSAGIGFEISLHIPLRFLPLLWKITRSNLLVVPISRLSFLLEVIVRFMYVSDMACVIFVLLLKTFY